MEIAEIALFFVSCLGLVSLIATCGAIIVAWRLGKSAKTIQLVFGIGMIIPVLAITFMFGYFLILHDGPG